MAAALPLCLWFKTSLLISLLLIFPISSSGLNLGMVEQGFQDEDAKSSLQIQKGKGNNMIGVSGSGSRSGSRKLLTLGAMLDYDDTGANPKHDPRKKPGKP